MFRVHQHVDDVNVCSFPPFLWVGCCGVRCTHYADTQFKRGQKEVQQGCYLIELLQLLASIFFLHDIKLRDGGTRALAARKPINDQINGKKCGLTTQRKLSVLMGGRVWQFSALLIRRFRDHDSRTQRTDMDIIPPCPQYRVSDRGLGSKTSHSLARHTRVQHRQGVEWAP